MGAAEDKGTVIMMKYDDDSKGSPGEGNVLSAGLTISNCRHLITQEPESPKDLLRGVLVT